MSVGPNNHSRPHSLKSVNMLKIMAMSIFYEFEKRRLESISVISILFMVTHVCIRHIPNSCHYSDVIMSAMVSQFTSLIIVNSTVYTSKKNQSSASMAFVWGIHRGPANSPHKWPVTRKMFPFDDHVITHQCSHIHEILSWQMKMK